MPWQFPNQPANPLRIIMGFYALAAFVGDFVYEEQSQFLELADLFQESAEETL